MQALGHASALLIEDSQSARVPAEHHLSPPFAPEISGQSSIGSNRVDFSLLRLKLEYRLKSEHLPSGKDLADVPIHSETLFGPTEFTLPKVENALKEAGFKTVRYGTNLFAVDHQYDRPLTVFFETLVDSQTQINIKVANKIR